MEHQCNVLQCVVYGLVIGGGGAGDMEHQCNCHALTLEILIIFYVWLGQGVTRVGNSMSSVSLFLAECCSQSEAAVYRCL